MTLVLLTLCLPGPGYSGLWVTPASADGPGATGPGLLTRSQSKIGCGCHSHQAQTVEAVWGVHDQEYGSELQPQGPCDQGWERN